MIENGTKRIWNNVINEKPYKQQTSHDLYYIYVRAITEKWFWKYLKCSDYGLIGVGPITSAGTEENEERTLVIVVTVRIEFKNGTFRLSPNEPTCSAAIYLTTSETWALFRWQ
jgi:hypothetical protein